MSENEAPQVDETEPETAGRHVTLNVANETLTTLSVKQRRIGLRLLPYNTVAVHPRYGPLLFEPGAFCSRAADGSLGPVDPKSVRLRMDHQDPPTGRGNLFIDQADAPYMEFGVSKTERGNDQLTLADDEVSRGASVGFDEVPGATKQRRIGGQTVTVYPPRSAVLAEVSTTWQPTFEGAAVMYVLSRDEKGSGPEMAEAQEAPVAGAPIITASMDYDRLTAAILAAQGSGERDKKIDGLLGKFDQLVELNRAHFTVPDAQPKRKPLLKDWFGVTLRKMAGQHVSENELKELALDDIITGDNPGAVPEVFTGDYDDLIDQDRPFLTSTRQVRPPATGNVMSLPIITQRAVAGSQYGGEKTEVTTTGPRVGTGNFPAVNVLAGADVSFQTILRADRSYLDLLDAEFAEAYALDEEQKAIAALLAGYTDSASVTHTVNNGGVMDPEDPDFGTAFKNSVRASRRRPTHIWMSVDAMAAFINAKDPLNNAPLYSLIAASITAGGGASGVVSGLIPVYVPAMDTSGVDVIIGPSRGFVWAEDPKLRLQADNPSLGGRDILLAGTLFPAPRYADAFTTYTVAS